MAPSRLLYTPDETCAALGLTRRQFYRLVKAGEVPVVHLGRLLRVPAKSLDAWIALKSRRRAA